MLASRILRWVPIAFLIQFALVLGGYFAVHNFDIPMFMRVMGSPRVVAGWPTFVTLGAYNRYSSMPATLHAATLDLRCGESPVAVELERPRSEPAVWFARFTVPPDCTRIDGHVQGELARGLSRSFDFSIPVVARGDASSSWHRALWSWRPPARTGQNASGGLSVRPRDEDCGHQLSVTTPASYPSRFMPALMSFRLVADDGLPVASTELVVSAAGAGASPPQRVTTDVLGIATVEMEFPEQTTLTVSYSCGDTTVERFVDVQPGWIQERVIPVPWIQRADMPVSLSGEFTRSGDEWLDVVQCEGVMVAAREMRVGAHARQEWSVGAGAPVGAGSSPAHCVHHRLAFLSQNPQRTTTFMVRRDDDQTDGVALAAFVATQRSWASVQARAFLGEQTEQLLAVADSAGTSRFAAWWSGFPPAMYEPPAVVGDDLEAVREELELVRGTGLARIRVILLVEAFVLVVWMLSVFIPARRATLRRMQAALADVDEEHLTEFGGAGLAGGWVPLVLSLVMLLLVMTGIGVLVGLMG